MVLGTVGWLAASYFGYKALSWGLGKVAGDPEGDLATSIAKTEGQKAYIPAMQASEAESAERFAHRQGNRAQDLLTEVGSVRAGWRDDEMAGNTSLVEQVAAKTGLSVEELRRRLTPPGGGPKRSLSSAALRQFTAGDQ